MSELKNLNLIYKGKNRDVYEVDENHLLIHTTDRISVFDCILPDPIPGRGELLTSATRFWCNKTQKIISNHISQASILLEDVISPENEFFKSCQIVRRYVPILVESVVRGYLYGSAWNEYSKKGTVRGEPMPEGMVKAQKFLSPLFSPTTKAPHGEHDQPLFKKEYTEFVGDRVAEQIEKISIQLYEFAHEVLLQKGFVLADTKFEFGLDENERLVLIDEVITPDSSRIWGVDTYIPGQNQKSYDKDIVREYVNSCLTIDPKIDITNTRLPQEVIDLTINRYKQSCENIFFRKA